MTAVKLVNNFFTCQIEWGYGHCIGDHRRAVFVTIDSDEEDGSVVLRSVDVGLEMVSYRCDERSELSTGVGRMKGQDGPGIQNHVVFEETMTALSLSLTACLRRN